MQFAIKILDRALRGLMFVCFSFRLSFTVSLFHTLMLPGGALNFVCM